MKIELASVKHMPSLSDETECFTAIVIVDGVKAFSAENRGCGGSTDFHPLPAYSGPCFHDVDLALKTSRPQVDLGEGLTIDHDLEWEVGALLEQHIARKRLDRMLKSKIVVLVEDKGRPALATYPAKHKPTPANLAAVAASIEKRGEKAEVVNGNPALEARALELV